MDERLLAPVEQLVLAADHTGIGVPGVLQRFRSGVAWNLLATVSNQGSTLAANVLIASLIGQAGFGRYSVVLSTVQLLSAFAGLSIGYTATRYLAEFRDTDRIRAGRVYGCGHIGIVAASVTMGVLLYTFAGPIALNALNAPALSPLLRVAAISVVFTTMSGFRAGVLGGLEEYKLLGQVGAASGVCYLATGVGLTLRWGIVGAIIGLLLSALFQWVLLGYAVRVALRRHEIVPQFKYGPAEVDIVRRFVVPGALSGLTAAPALWLAQAALARTPGGFAQAGLYAAAYNLMALVLFLPSVANAVGMTLLNHVLGRREVGTYERVFWINLWTSLGISGLGIVGVLGLSPWLLQAYGTEFKAATPILALLLVATIPEVLTIALNQLLQSRERMWTAVLWVNIPRDSLIVVAALALAPRFGARGLALAYLLGKITAAIAIAIVTYRLGGARLAVGVSQSKEAT